MNDEPSQRLEKIEANFTHLEHQVEQLNQVIIEQGKVVDDDLVELFHLMFQVSEVRLDLFQTL